MIVSSTPWIHDGSKITAMKTSKYCRLYGITEAMPAVVTEPSRTTCLRHAPRTWKQASKSVCLRHAART
ncbi:MAG: hypothetical protein V7L21_18710 [Nostoc sp.]